MVNLGQGAVEALALRLRELQLEVRRLAGTVGAREGTGAPRGATTDLAQVAEDRERQLVAKRDEDDAVVGECAHGGDGGGLLAAAWGAGGDEDAGISDEIR